MKREILFRGKRKDNGEWIEGSLLSLSLGRRFICDGTVWIGTLNPCKYEIIPESIGQYTDLTDKNGTRIFEGDVLKSDNGDVGIVKMMPEYCAFMILIKSENRYCYLWDNYFSYIEVIGNIHDNPELMESETS